MPAFTDGLSWACQTMLVHHMPMEPMNGNNKDVCGAKLHKFLGTSIENMGYHNCDRSCCEKG